jgi:hypothetical protein
MAAPTYERFLPDDSREFRKHLYDALDKAARPPRDKENDEFRQSALSGLARQGFRWAMRREAVGGPPTLAQFGSREFAQWNFLAEDVDAAWAFYSDAVSSAIEDLANAADAPLGSSRPESPHPTPPPTEPQANAEKVVAPAGNPTALVVDRPSLAAKRGTISVTMRAALPDALLQPPEPPASP